MFRNVGTGRSLTISRETNDKNRAAINALSGTDELSSELGVFMRMTNLDTNPPQPPPVPPGPPKPPAGASKLSSFIANFGADTDTNTDSDTDTDTDTKPHVPIDVALTAHEAEVSMHLYPF